MYLPTHTLYYYIMKFKPVRNVKYLHIRYLFFYNKNKFNIFLNALNYLCLMFIIRMHIQNL